MTHGVYLLWWVQERHLSPALVASILAAGDLALLLLQVPTGWFADRFGHRLSLLAGSAAQVVGMIACWLGRGVPALIAASVLVAAGDAFRSGADQALLFRTCAALGCEAEFQRIESRTRALQLAALVCLTLAGGAIVALWGFGAAWAAETILCSIGFAIAWAMREPPHNRRSAAFDDPSVAPATLHSALRPLLALTLPAAFLTGVANAASFLAQTTGQAEPLGLSVLVSVITLAEAAGAAAASRAPATGVRTQRWLLLGALGATGLAAVLPSTFFIVLIVLSLLLGLSHPLRAAAIQQSVADEVRARAASVASACDMAFNMVALPLAGVYRVRRSSRR